MVHRIELSERTEEGGKVFAVSVDGSPVMADTADPARALAMAEQVITNMHRRGQRFAVTRWNGDTAESTPITLALGVTP